MDTGDSLSLDTLEKFASNKFNVASVAVEISKGGPLGNKCVSIFKPILCDFTLYDFGGSNSATEIASFLQNPTHDSWWHAEKCIPFPDNIFDSGASVQSLQDWLRSYRDAAYEDWQAKGWIAKPRIVLAGRKQALASRIVRIKSMVDRDGNVQRNFLRRMSLEIERFAETVCALRVAVYGEPADCESSEDVELVSVTVSTLCPISMTEIRDPVKGTHCTHVQAIERESYVALAQQRKGERFPWRCPICNKNYLRSEIVFDKAFSMYAKAQKTRGDVIELSSSDGERWERPVEEKQSPKRLKQKESVDLARTEHGTMFLKSLRQREPNLLRPTSAKKTPSAMIGGVDESSSVGLSSPESSFDWVVGGDDKSSHDSHSSSNSDSSYQFVVHSPSVGSESCLSA